MAPAPQDEAQGRIIREFLVSIWLHKWLVLGFAAAGIVVAIVHLHRTPPSYTVTLRVASVALEQSQSRTGGDRVAGLAALALVINIQESGPAACLIMQKPMSTHCETLFGSNSAAPSAPAHS